MSDVVAKTMDNVDVEQRQLNAEELPIQSAMSKNEKQFGGHEIYKVANDLALYFKEKHQTSLTFELPVGMCPLDDNVHEFIDLSSLPKLCLN